MSVFRLGCTVASAIRFRPPWASRYHILSHFLHPSLVSPHLGLAQSIPCSCDYCWCFFASWSQIHPTTAARSTITPRSSPKLSPLTTSAAPITPFAFLFVSAIEHRSQSDQKRVEPRSDIPAASLPRVRASSRPTYNHEPNQPANFGVKT